MPERKDEQKPKSFRERLFGWRVSDEEKVVEKAVREVKKEEPEKEAKLVTKRVSAPKKKSDSPALPATTKRNVPEKVLEKVPEDAPKKNARMSRKEVKEVLAQKQARGETQREAYAMYRRAKAHAALMEEGNMDKIIVFPSVDAPWYKIGGKSALYYAYDIALRVCSKKELPVVRPDTDHDLRFRDGIVCIRKIDKLVARLRTAGIINYEVLSDGIYVFQLKREYTAGELKNFRNTKYRKGEELENLATAKRVYPEIRGLINKTIALVMPKAKKLPQFYQETIGMRLAEAVREMNDAYFDLANERVKKVEAFKRIVMADNQILNELMILKEIDAWNAVELIEIGGLMVDLKVAVKRAVNKIDAEPINSAV